MTEPILAKTELLGTPSEPGLADFEERLSWTEHIDGKGEDGVTWWRPGENYTTVIFAR
jgi:hypothetical protein